MCGIVAYTGNKQAVTVLVPALKRLEYRGYDSAGMGIHDGCSDTLTILKRPGKIASLEAAMVDMALQGTCGIAHTRWATHGVPNEVNAHPHTDLDVTIAIAHNGMIENFKPLKKLLESLGCVFVSETDSEVIAHLIDKTEGATFLERVQRVVRRLQGTFGIVVISSQYPGQIVVARQGSPVVLGIGENEYFVSSDTNALLEHTRNVVYLKDGEIALLDPHASKPTIVTFDNEQVELHIDELDQTLNQIELGTFEHYMLKEIHEQPDAVTNTMRGRVFDETISINGIHENLSDLLGADLILLTACGTSWHAALIGAIVIEELTGIPCEVHYASELATQVRPAFPAKTIMIAISQSGETKDTDLAIQAFQARGGKVLGICNVVNSTIYRRTNGGILVHAGPEIGVASTKAFTAQVTALAMIAAQLGMVNGFIEKTYRPGWALDFLAALREIPEKISLVLAKAPKIMELAQVKVADEDQLFRNRNALFLGRGINFPVALEGALKLKEISYIHAEGYPAAEMKHGPIALIDKHMFVVVLASNVDKCYTKVLDNIREIKARKGFVIAIANEGDDEIASVADFVVYVPTTSYFLTPLLFVVPLQLLAYYIAKLRGCDIDKPRNLAKAVTVE